MNHYQLLFEVIERHTGKVLLQSEMDEVVSACELLNGTAALRAENAKLRSGLGAVVDMIEEMYELKDVDKISDRRYRKGRTAYLSTTPDPLYLASPEMLEALTLVDNLLKHAYSGATNFAVVEKAKVAAAIAKAKGEQIPSGIN